jgi:DNA-directed RNA polymerase specialized sigma24 family protein
MARNAAEFDEFYRATSRRVLRYAYAVTGDLSEARAALAAELTAPSVDRDARALEVNDVD